LNAAALILLFCSFDCEFI